MYLVNGGSQKTSSSHSCNTVMPISLRCRDWLAAGVRRPSKNASPIPSGAGCGTARHALQKLPQSSARFGLSAVPPQAGPTRPGPAPARKQENRKYFTEVPHASCSPVFGMARGGSPCLLFSSSRLDHPQRTRNVRGRVGSGRPALSGLNRRHTRTFVLSRAWTGPTGPTGPTGHRRILGNLVVPARRPQELACASKCTWECRSGGTQS